MAPIKKLTVMLLPSGILLSPGDLFKKGKVEIWSVCASVHAYTFVIHFLESNLLVLSNVNESEAFLM